MEKNLKIFCLFICIISCKSNDNNKSDIELTTLNDTLFAYSFEMRRDTINFLRFEILNNSNKIYYINDIVNSGRFFQKSVYKERVQLRIFNANNEEVEYGHMAYYNDYRYSSDELNNCFNVCEKINVLDSERRFSISDKPNYYYYGYKYNKSFFIHPKEKLYFEIYLNITDTLLYESERIGYAELSKNTSYRGQVSIVSDTTDFRTSLPRHILKTIEANNVEIYHGIIKSKNYVQIKVIE